MPDPSNANAPLEAAISEALRSKTFDNFDRAYDLTPTIAAAIRSLPVEQRMEAMGMKPCAICADGKHYMEDWRA